MAKKTIRTTFALDPETVADLDRLAERWNVSKSEVVRRIVNTAAIIEEADAASDAIAALEELQERLALTEEQADEWIRNLRAEREAAGP
ncbi:MAG: ribbon-helix-helix protein, CopG family [Gemmatimonadota bacterium]